VYWADELAAAVAGPQVVNDSKSPSGTVHVGSLRGVVLHDAIHRALLGAGLQSKFLYGVDDMDAMDSAALLTPDAIERYMGAPLSRVPAPEGSSAANYARHFVGEIFLRTFEPLGIRPEFYWVSELYAAGQMDPCIRLALDRADRVRDIYRRVSHVERPSSWLPIQVICDQCGRIGTTYATDWDGATVAYQCKPDMVSWARGCGHEGRVSPLGGRAKLPWNLEWAAKWGLLGVTIEGCGKDLATAGGSRDRSDAISREVFEVEPPRNVAYEFLNVGGKKMSTSRGQGAAAHTIAEVLPPEQLRFLFLRPRPSQVIEFDPEGDTIPRLFDEFDRIASATAGREVKGELPADHERLFAYSLVAAGEAPGIAGAGSATGEAPDIAAAATGIAPGVVAAATTDSATGIAPGVVAAAGGPSPKVAAAAAAFRPAFAHLALLLQIPGVDIRERMEAEKGAPLTELETAILAERTASARAWLDSYAPERARLVIRHDAVPDEVAALDAAQRGYLGALAAVAGAESPRAGDAWQALIFRIASETELPSGRAFGALYAAFLGRTNGPRAGWLLASLEPAFVLDRLRAAAG
jgi:lysyl-tRNA synthetase